MQVRPARHLPAAAAVLSALLLASCAAGAEPEAAAPPAARPAATASPDPSPDPSPVPSPRPSPAVRTLEVAYAGGEVTGTSGREPVTLGEHLVLRVTSDVAEEVHVHGYDLEAPVAAGGTVDIPVHATIPGVFEVELHESGTVLFQLRVA